MASPAGERNSADHPHCAESLPLKPGIVGARDGFAVGAIICGWAACAASSPTVAPTPIATATATPGKSAAQEDSKPAAAPTVTDILADERGALDTCYAAARVTNPRLGPTSVVFAFVIDQGGKPTTVDLEYRHRMDDRTKECMRDAALTLSFPRSMQGPQTATLVFKPAP
jgi:hypothetical protein